MARDQDVVSLALDHARGDGPDAVLGHELDADAGGRVAVLAVVDELREILDGVDVVVGRRGDEGHASLGTAKGRDVGRNLLAGELTALAGLGALGHLNLNLVRVAQVVRGDSETARRDLLNRRSLRVVAAVRLGDQALDVLASFAGVGLAADAVHRARQGAVRLEGDGAVGHSPGTETLDDVTRGFHRFDVDGFPVALERDHAA
mmetsp:Transcript_6293/g.28422  ORF Transcript_6293/g.28422 Transcript_6293/m.28422 type:complete len:204 (+) Transcript_6293:4274-4885(+)